jgi:hypothetical protein
MQHSELFLRAVYTDRVRDLERAARDRRLMAPADEPVQNRLPVTQPRVAPATGRNPCGDSAGVPA